MGSISLRRRLRVETLEQKKLLAGDVTAELVEGHLIVSGDEMDNQVAVRSGEMPGQFVVVGLTGPDGEQTTVNGSQDPVVVNEVRRNVVVRMGDGDDVLRLANARIRGNALIGMGDGDDTVLVGGRDPAPDPPQPVAAGVLGDVEPPPEPMRLGPSVAVGQNLVIVTGDGDDRVWENSTRVGKNNRINTGDGDDAVHIGQPRRPVLEPDAEQLGDDGDGDTEAPNIAPHRPGLAVGGNLTVHLGAGDDALHASHARVAGKFQAGAGRGDDSIALDHVWAGRRIYVRGGLGDDDIGMHHVHARTSYVNSGAGDDEVTIVDSVFGRLGAWMGRGDDVLRVGGTRVRGAALFNGGPGEDALVRLGGNALHRIAVVNFEHIGRPEDEPAVEV